MKRKFLAASVLASALVGLPADRAHAGDPAIRFTLDGKPVTDVPIERLGDVSVTVESGDKPFNGAFKGQWAGIDQNLNLVAEPFKRGTAQPSLAGSDKWKGAAVATTSKDSTWGDSSDLGGSLGDLAGSLGLNKATAGEDLAFTARFRRRVYTGRTYYENGAWVKEAKWETVGPPLGQAVLRLLPPTFEKDFNAATLAAGARLPKDQAESFAQVLLYPVNYADREVTFEGSKLLGVEVIPGKAPAYNWDSTRTAKVVRARIPVVARLRAAMQTSYRAIPIPVETAGEFTCPMVLTARRATAGGAWEFEELASAPDFRTAARSADGKTADEVAGPATPADATKNLLKGFGL